MESDQQKVDAFFGTSAEMRAEMSKGRVPSELRQQGASPVTVSAPVLLVTLAPILGLLLAGGHAVVLGGLAGIVWLVLVARALRERDRGRRPEGGGRVEASEGHAETRRYWFPTYGEVSRLCAELLLDERRYILPTSFEDHVIVGPVRVYWHRPGTGEQAATAAAIELLPGSVLSRRSPTRPPPEDFLRIESADG